MAQGRMIQRRISTSKKLACLVASVDVSHGFGHGAHAALLYSWCLAHLDVDGRMEGDPGVVRGNVVPRIKHYTDELVADYLRTMHAVGLVHYYEADDDWWLEFRNFDENQPGLRKEKEAKSRIPRPPKIAHSGPTPDLLRTNDGISPAEENRKRREEKRREENENPARTRVGEISKAWHDAGLPPNGNHHELSQFGAEYDAAVNAAADAGQTVPPLVDVCRELKGIVDGWVKAGKTPKYQPSRLATSLGLAIQLARDKSKPKSNGGITQDLGELMRQRLNGEG